MTWAIILAFARKNWQALALAAVCAAVLMWGLRGYSLADDARRERDEALATAETRTAERDKARMERAAALDAAAACSASVQSLKDAADKRHATAAPARHQAATTAQRKQEQAAVILQTPPAVPGDDAASARARIDAWIAGRGQ